MKSMDLASFFGIVVSASLLSAPAAAITLGDAVFHEEYYIQGNCNVVVPCDPTSATGLSDATPESIHGDWSSDVAEGIAAVSTYGGPAPMVDIQTHAAGQYQASVVARAYIDYSFAVVSKANPDVVESIPLTVTINGSMDLTAQSKYFNDDYTGSVLYSYLTSWAYIDYEQIGFERVTIGTNYGCYAYGSAFCTATSHFDPQVSQTVTASTNTYYSGHVEAFVRNDGGNGEVFEAQAVADPIIGFLNPEDAQLYDIVFSPNIGSPAPAPIPAALPLMLSALGGLGFMGWRKRKAVATT